MRNKWFSLILIVSVAFNLAFVGMYIWHRLHRPRPHFPPEFRHMREHFGRESKELRTLRGDFMSERDRFIDFLRSDNFTEEGAEMHLAKMIAKQVKLEERFGNKLIELRKEGVLPEKMEPDSRLHNRLRDKPKKRRNR